MELGELLRTVGRVEDLPRLLEALGYEPAWRPLPNGEVVVATRGDFSWRAILSSERESALRLARRLASAGCTDAALALDLPGRRLVLAVDAASLVLTLDSPRLLDLARLARCAAHPGEGALAAGFRIAEALDGLGVDDRFFAGFRETLDRVVAALPQRIPGIDRHALGLLQLTRILFLYFIEAKGWLDGRPRFLREAVDNCLAHRRSLHRDLLQPLFFGTLNRPPGSRSRIARQFGGIPFLNGGLFEPHALERRWRVMLPTPVLCDAFDRLFDRYHFTLSPGGGSAVAPDMLGRVFEGVMEPVERHRTGSYYTPAPLVEAMVADGLATWLAGRLGIGWPEARRRLDDRDPATVRALRCATVLDPAVGSGAFLLGALRLLAGSRERPSAAHSTRLREVLQTQLFGVDRNAAAVRLAELRLWLEVVGSDPSTAPEDVSPLPNLDALIRQGDSLSDPAVGLPLPAPESRDAGALRTLRQQLVAATGALKRPAVEALVRAERRIAEAAFTGAVQRLDSSIVNLLSAARSPSLFGDRLGLTRVDREAISKLRAARRRARAQLRAIRRTGEVPWFHYPVHFADVTSAGGFDLVVGNPPWVRAEALDPEQRRYFLERYRWFRGERSAGKGYCHHADLALVFVERALELLAPKGVVAFLVPGKLATAGYAGAAREGLCLRTTISVAAQLRHDAPAAFDATVYPMALVASLGAPPEWHRLRTRLDGEETGPPQRTLGAGPWTMVADAARDAMERLRRQFPMLGEQMTCHLGVKTGLNRVFLDPPAEVERELVRWAVRGRDVGPFTVRRARRLLWTCDERGRPLESLPPGAARHINVHAAALRRRSDHAGGPPWTLFRTRAAAAPHRVVWADVARRLEAAVLGGGKRREAIPLNSCYVALAPNPDTAVRLSAWLNSSWCRVLAAAVADPASGGYARFNARAVSLLPCPPEVLTDRPLLTLGQQGASGDLSQEALDDRCADLLGLAPSERDALAGLPGAGADPPR